MGKTTEKITDAMKEQIKELASNGKTDREIAEILGNVTDGAILYWRKKLGVKSKFTYSKIAKIDSIKFKELFDKGLSDYVIAKELNVSPDGVYAYRKRHNITRDINLRFNKPIELTDFQKQVLLGTIIGDASFKMGKGSINPSISCAHSIKQKEYCEYKTKIFENLGAYCKYHKRNFPDKRNGNIYEDYTMYVPANPELKSWYDSFYKNGKKVIPFELFEYFTEVSLAFMFMDDGSRCHNSFTIATNCFSMKELIKFKEFLYKKFFIEVTIRRDHTLYIKACSRNLFIKLISPYIHECVKYKIQTVS